MKNHLFARIMRASGRLLLFVGIIFSLGLALYKVYSIIYFTNHPDAPRGPLIPTQNAATGAALDQPVSYVTVLIGIAATVLAVLLLYIVATVYNRNIRGLIGRLARLFHAQIFTVEIVTTLITWTIATLLLAFIIPLLSIITIFAFIINELLFIFAWGAYGQPNYKI
jgi:hypothetical protein